MTTSLLVLLQRAADRLGSHVSPSGEPDRGATATEYAMLVAFIAVAIAVAVTAFGTQLSAFFGGLGDTLHF